MINPKFCLTIKSELKEEYGWKTLLKDVYLEKNPCKEDIDLKDFYVTKMKVEDKKKGWSYHKGAKKEKRIDPETGFEYDWAEGNMSVTDSLDKPSRTIITSEGGASPSRTKHLIKVKESGRNAYRRLHPVELERLCMFPDNFTKLDGVNTNQRAFLMGNALVVGIIEKVGRELAKRISE